MHKLSSLWIAIIIIMASCGLRKPVVEPPIEIVQEESSAQIFPTNEQAAPTAATSTATPIPVVKVTPTLTNVVLKPSLTSTPEPMGAPLDGIHFYNPLSQSQVTLIKQAGATWTRGELFYWDLIEPIKLDPPVYDWSKVDEAGIQLLAANELQVIAVVLFAPDWAQKVAGSACGPIAEEELDRFALFMAELVKRYSQEPYNILYWEIGNEPDVDHTLVAPHSGYGCWGDKDQPFYGGEYYAEMLKRIYPKVKEANANAQLIVGGLLMDCNPIMPPENPAGSGNLKDCSPTLFFEGILANDGGNFFDGVSFHAYDYYNGDLGQYRNENWRSSWDKNGPVLIQKVHYLKTLMASYHQQDKFLICTETALVCGRDGSEALCKTDDFANTKAYYIVEEAAAAAANHLKVNIWYSLYGWRGSGLVRSKTEITPEYTAYLFSTQMLRQAEYIKDIIEFPGIAGYEFLRNGKLIWVLWSLDGEMHTISLDVSPSKVFNVWGEGISIEDGLKITLAPIYVEW